MARREKKTVPPVQMAEGKRAIIQLLQEHDIESAQDVQDCPERLAGGNRTISSIRFISQTHFGTTEP